MFKIGDLVKLNAAFDKDKHPPMGTLGIITDVEDWSDCNSLEEYEQFLRVHWAHNNNFDTQCYLNSSVLLVDKV